MFFLTCWSLSLEDCWYSSDKKILCSSAVYKLPCIISIVALFWPFTLHMKAVEKLIRQIILDSYYESFQHARPMGHGLTRHILELLSYGWVVWLLCRSDNQWYFLANGSIFQGILVAFHTFHPNVWNLTRTFSCSNTNLFHQHSYCLCVLLLVPFTTVQSDTVNSKKMIKQQQGK